MKKDYLCFVYSIANNRIAQTSNIKTASRHKAKLNGKNRSLQSETELHCQSMKKSPLDLIHTHNTNKIYTYI